MKDWSNIRERYLNDSLPIRLGGLAANLLRIKSFSLNRQNREAVEGLLDESKHFIEWTALEADIQVAAELVELQVLLARWQYRLDSIWTQEAQLQRLSEQAASWSNRVLQFSGLLETK
jgi:hypothetical protein